jgi:hypothetical protein
MKGQQQIPLKKEERHFSVVHYEKLHSSIMQVGKRFDTQSIAGHSPITVFYELAAPALCEGNNLPCCRKTFSHYNAKNFSYDSMEALLS